jgi:hypothetical protein
VKRERRNATPEVSRADQVPQRGDHVHHGVRVHVHRHPFGALAGEQELPLLGARGHVDVGGDPRLPAESLRAGPHVRARRAEERGDAQVSFRHFVYFITSKTDTRKKTFRHTQQIDVDEKAILPAGFVDRGNQEGDDDDFLVTLQGITNVISQRKFAIFTCLGHSTCAFYTPDDQYCFFDPAPACIIADMSREQLHGMLRSNRQIGGSQCDVTLLSLRSGQS